MERIDEHVWFANGYGLSIQRSKYHYCDTNTFEVAVLHRNNELPDDFFICYLTPMTDDVISHVTWQNLAELMAQVAKLNANHLCNHWRDRINV